MLLGLKRVNEIPSGLADDYRLEANGGKDIFIYFLTRSIRRAT